MVTILVTGLPASGKTTFCVNLQNHMSDYKFTFLDGDDVRRVLCPDLGFSRDDRIANLRRMGFIAKEVNRHGGNVLIASIAPYDESRRILKSLVESVGGKFILVYMDTPLSTCVERDPKGLYKKAFMGQITNLTGIGDPYEIPMIPDFTVNESTDMLDLFNNIKLSF